MLSYKVIAPEFLGDRSGWSFKICLVFACLKLGELFIHDTRYS